MSRKHSGYLLVIVMLVLVNAWRWGAFGTAADKHDATHGKTLVAEDFRLHIDASGPAGPVRDLFRPAGGEAAKPRVRPVQAVIKAAPPIPPPELATATADSADLGKLKLLGVVFRAGKGQAYLAFDKENVIAHSGDTVMGRFAVASIGIDSVDITDLKTNSSRKIPVSGR